MEKGRSSPTFNPSPSFIGTQAPKDDIRNNKEYYLTPKRLLGVQKKHLVSHIEKLSFMVEANQTAFHDLMQDLRELNRIVMLRDYKNEENPIVFDDTMCDNEVDIINEIKSIIMEFWIERALLHLGPGNVYCDFKLCTGKNHKESHKAKIILQLRMTNPLLYCRIILCTQCHSIMSQRCACRAKTAQPSTSLMAQESQELEAIYVALT